MAAADGRRKLNIYKCIAAYQGKSNCDRPQAQAALTASTVANSSAS
jgi:hypothetical protein